MDSVIVFVYGHTCTGVSFAHGITVSEMVISGSKGHCLSHGIAIFETAILEVCPSEMVIPRANGVPSLLFARLSFLESSSHKRAVYEPMVILDTWADTQRQFLHC
jgi:hypothetical protein